MLLKVIAVIKLLSKGAIAIHKTESGVADTILFSLGLLTLIYIDSKILKLLLWQVSTILKCSFLRIT